MDSFPLWGCGFFGNILFFFSNFCVLLPLVTFYFTHTFLFWKEKNRWPFPGSSHLLGPSVQSPLSDGYSASCLVVGGSFPFRVPGRRLSPFFHGWSASHAAFAFFLSGGYDGCHFLGTTEYWCPIRWTHRTRYPPPYSSWPGHHHGTFDAFVVWPGIDLVHPVVASLAVPLDSIVPPGSSSVPCVGPALPIHAHMPVAFAGVPYRWAVALGESIPWTVDAFVAIGLVGPGSESIPVDG